MDPDDDSLTDRGSGPVAGQRGPDRSKAQADQDAWVARWAGWDHVEDRSGYRDGVAAARLAAQRGPQEWGEPAPAWRPSGRAILAGVATLLIGIGLLGGILIKVPYVALVPGMRN